MSVRVRYAPSPTGLQHIGGIRTALYNYFFARSQKGKFILRIEDTDRLRFTEGALQDLYDTLRWLGIEWDEGPIVGGPYGPYIQSERFAIYHRYAKQLVDEQKAYYCYCTAERLERLREEQAAGKAEVQGYDRHCRNLSEQERKAREDEGIKPVIRLKVPLEGKTTFHDVLMGDITRRNRDINPDPVLLKSDGFPTYHLANVIDDHLMGITHIMRAQEWIPSGALHVLLYEAFGWEVPLYCHLPMVMGKDGQKLSKRHGATAVREFREKGYLAEALINYISMVGWSYDGERQFFTKEELCELFSLDKLSKAPGVFDYKKLDWYNGVYIRRKSDEELAALLVPFLTKEGFICDPPTAQEYQLVLSLVPPVKERLKTLSDVVPLVRFLFTDVTVTDPKALIPSHQDAQVTLRALRSSLEIIQESGTQTTEELEKRLAGVADNFGVKLNGVFMPIRVALTGSTVSLPLLDVMRLLGTDTVTERLKRAIFLLEHEVA